ncbi:NAD(P)/FAD-dependent oxidoreductase [Microlunatus speluncae]|uniref:NAD(P)/FAD-dependent oxidoreductase n=1 Tax=Microlunatus speluncae TaxID=2594267 RepID=UPI0012660E1F|nr:NAD(P)/FAD-dependent oxidoreductase [Microlunatus speluncae]
MSGQTTGSPAGQGFDYDVIVIGGGAAGLSGAVALARFRRSVAVIDSGEPRNAPAEGVHNLLGRENVSPADLLATGRAELAGYGGAVITGVVATAEHDQQLGGFEVGLTDGRRFRARRLLLASGVVDTLPDLPGVAELWGRAVLHCPYCHGWEFRDQAIGILATGPMATHQALMFRQLSDDVLLFRHTAALDDDQLEQLAARGITVIDGEVTALERDPSGELAGVRLAGGTVVPRQAIVVAPTMEARAGFLTTLGLQPEPVEVNGVRIGSKIAADGNGATAVPGVWAAGNLTNPMAHVMISAAAGLTAGAVINGDLITEETAAAVAAARARAQPQPLDPVG